MDIRPTIGYLDAPENARPAITADGWLRTGDLGTLDKRGYLRVTGRLEDIPRRREYLPGRGRNLPAAASQHCRCCGDSSGGVPETVTAVARSTSEANALR
nr:MULTISPECIES: AMP-binding protein [Bradyrhizobium]